MSLTVILLFLVALTLLGIVALYNQLARLRNATANARAQIDVQLKRRYDLIPNLVEVARKYMAHERETLEAVTAARNAASDARQALQRQPASAQAAAALGQTEALLQGRYAQLLAVAEAYPELKADQTMRDLAEEITHTENTVGFARQAYNDSVLDYNNAVVQFPSTVVARLFGFVLLPMLESIQRPEERDAPRVNFSGSSV